MDVTFDEAQQELVNKLVGEARTKARDKAAADFEAQSAKEKGMAERAALAAQDEWQKLAEEHAARVDELEPLVALVEAYQEAHGEMLKDRVKALGDAAKKAVAELPGSPTDLEKLNWLSKSQGVFDAGPLRVGTPAARKRVPGKTDKGREGHRPIRL